MIDYIGIERATSEDFISNSTKRVPICICADTSLSMVLNGGIKHVNEGIQQFIDKTANNIYSSDAVDLCVVAFGAKAVQTVIPFENVVKIKERSLFQPISAGGSSPLGSAVELSLNHIIERANMYDSYGVSSYTPWLIIMSDGKANDSSKVDEIAPKVIDMQKPNNGKKARLKVQCIGMGNGQENNDLQKFSLTQNIKHWDALQIENFFNFLSESATQLSCAYPGEEDVIGLL